MVLRKNTVTTSWLSSDDELSSLNSFQSKFIFSFSLSLVLEKSPLVFITFAPGGFFEVKSCSRDIKRGYHFNHFLLPKPAKAFYTRVPLLSRGWFNQIWAMNMRNQISPHVMNGYKKHKVNSSTDSVL